MLKKIENRIARAKRTRARITGTAMRPRLSVFRSNTSISVQAIDDTTGKTLVAANDLSIKSGTKMEKAKQVGQAIGQAMKDKGLEACVFDRGGYLYHGRIKALADAAREVGIQF